MTEIVTLIRLFWIQLTVRSVATVAFHLIVVGFFALLTTSVGPPLGLSGLSGLSDWVRTVDPWTVFVTVFVVLNAWEFLRVYQATLIDRFNFRALVARSKRDLDESEDPMASLPAHRAALNGRRRLLEHVLRLIPALASLGALAALLIVLGATWAGIGLVAALVAGCIAVPWLTARFDRRRAQVADRAEKPERPGRGTTPRMRAEAKLSLAVKRTRVIVDRPLERMLISWPVMLATLIAFVTISLGLIVAFSDRPTLLIVTLVISARALVTTSQQIQDAAFFASAVLQLDGGETGVEVI